jgi:phage terminase large subunit GpA-like protein
MLTAEEKRSDGSFYCPSGRRNEALDLRVYNLAARDFFIDLKIQELRDTYQKRGATKAQLLEIRSPAVLAMLAEATRQTIRRAG